MARPSWANTLGCRDFELTPLSMRPFWNESRKRFPGLATWGCRRRAGLTRCTRTARSHAAGSTGPEAGEATRSAGEDEAGSRPEHRTHVLAVLVHLPATAMVAATATTPVFVVAVIFFSGFILGAHGGGGHHGGGGGRGIGRRRRRFD